jgi:hypothetical protein
MPVFNQPGQLVKFLAARTGDKPARCCYHPAPLTDKDEHFELVCKIVRRAENMIFYVDEVDQFCTPTTMKPQGSTYWNHADRKGKRSEFDEMFDSGRHFGIAVVSLSRFPAQVARKITANSQEMRLFRQSEPTVIGYYADKIGRVQAECLPMLEDYTYLLWQDGREPVVAGGRR